MKKVWVFGLCLVLVLSAVACGKTPVNSAPENDLSDFDSASVGDTAKLPNNGYTDKDGVIHAGLSPEEKETVVWPSLPMFDRTRLDKEKRPLSEQEAEDIFWPLLSKAICIDQEINNCGFSHVEEKISLIWNEESQNGPTGYSLVTDETMKNMDDVWKRIFTAYTKQTGVRNFMNRLDAASGIARFLEYNGKLYYNGYGKGYNTAYIQESFRIVEQYEDTLVIRVDMRYGSSNTIDKAAFVLRRTPDGWRMDTGIGESDVKEYVAQFDKQAQ